MPTKTIVSIVAIVILEVVALLKGIDGAMLGFAIAAIAGLGGYAIGKKPAAKQ